MRGMPNIHPTSQFDFAGLDDWFAIFRAGEQIDSKGRKRTFTEADLDSIVANHNDEESAPFVFGHPKHNDPAYGWTASLKRDGDTLLAKGRDVVAEFETAVKKKMFPKRSISIVPEGDGWKLRHIGFLGARPPAVAGLGDIAFADDGQQVLEFALDEASLARRTGWGLESMARVLRGMREFLIEKFDLETADRVVPSYQIDSIAESGSAAAAMGDTQQGPLYMSPTQPDTGDVTVPGEEKQFSQADINAAVQSAVEAAQQKFQERESALQFEKRKDEAERLIDGLVAKGCLLPSQQEGLAEFMATLPAASDSAFEFAAADGKATSQTPAEFMTGFLTGLGKQIELGQNGSEAPGSTAAVDFAAPAGATVDPDRARLHQKALEYQREHNCEYVMAVKAVEGGK